MMQRSVVWRLALVLSAVTVALLYWLAQRSGPELPAASASVATVQPVADSSASELRPEKSPPTAEVSAHNQTVVSVANVEVSTELPVEGSALAEQFDALAARAREGDAAAARRLYADSSRCRRVSSGSAVGAIVDLQQVRAVVDPRSLQRSVQSCLQQSMCAGTTAAQLRDPTQWLWMAAQAGDLRARTSFASGDFLNSPDLDAFNYLPQMRANAMRWLLEGSARGDRMSIATLAAAYLAPEGTYGFPLADLVPYDPVLGLAHELAERRTQQGDNSEVISNLLARARASLSAAELIAAERMAAEIQSRIAPDTSDPSRPFAEFERIVWDTRFATAWRWTLYQRRRSAGIATTPASKDPSAMSRRVWLGLLLLGSLTVGWLLFSARSEAPQTASGGAAAVPGMAADSARGADTNAAQRSMQSIDPQRLPDLPMSAAAQADLLPAEDAPLAQTFDTLAERAKRGEAQAARRLYQDVSTCRSQRWQSSLRNSNPPPRLEQAKDQTQFRQMLQWWRGNALLLCSRARRCADVDVSKLQDPDQWLMRAAELGDLRARVDVASGTMFQSPASADTYQWLDRWRQTALPWLEQGVAAGDAGAMRALAQALVQPRDRAAISLLAQIVPADPERGYALLYALSLSTALGADPSVQQSLNEAGQRLDVTQRLRARRSGTDLYHQNRRALDAASAEQFQSLNRETTPAVRVADPVALAAHEPQCAAEVARQVSEALAAAGLQAERAAVRQ